MSEDTAFYESFHELLNPTESFEEANQFLLDLKENNPQLFLENLLSIIFDSKNNDNAKIVAIKALTMLGTHSKSSKLSRIQCAPQIVHQIYEHLFPFVERNDLLGETTFNVLKFFSKLVATDVFYQNYLVPYVMTYDEQKNPSELYLQRLFGLCKTHLLYKEGDIRQDLYDLCNFFAQHLPSFTLENTAKRILKLIIMSIPVLTADLIGSSFDDFILEFYATYAPQFVEYFKELQYSLLSTEYAQEKPAVIDILIDVSTQSFDQLKLLCWHVLRQYATKDHCILFVQRMFENADVEKTEKYPISEYHLREIVAKAELSSEAIQEMFSTYAEQMSTNGKYALSLIDEALLHGFIEWGDGLPDNYQLSILDTFPYFLNDDNLRIKSHGFSLICALIKRKIVTDYEEYLEYSLENLLSGDDIIKLDCINIILSIFVVSDDDTKMELGNQIFSSIQEHIEDEEPEDLKTILMTLTELSSYFPKEYAYECLQEIWSMTSTMFRESLDSPVLSNFVHLVGNLMKNVSIEGNEMLQQIAEFATELIDAEEEDGYYLMNIVCQEFGAQSPEILQYCIEKVLERLSSAANEKSLERLAELCMTVVPFIDDQSILQKFAETCISYMDSIDLKPNALIPLHQLLAMIHSVDAQLVNEFLPRAAFHFFKEFIYIDQPSFSCVKYLISLLYVHSVTNQIPISKNICTVIYHLLDFISFSKDEEENKAISQEFMAMLNEFREQPVDYKPQVRKKHYQYLLQYLDDDQISYFFQFITPVD